MIEPKIVVDRYVSPLLLLKYFVFTITSEKKKEKRTKITKDMFLNDLDLSNP
jgi:hypothetical protein